MENPELEIQKIYNNSEDESINEELDESGEEPEYASIEEENYKLYMMNSIEIEIGESSNQEYEEYEEYRNIDEGIT